MPKMEKLDELCAACSEVDFFSLFTGARYFTGDGYDDKAYFSLGSLSEIISNTNCPCCRLLTHALYKGPRSLWYPEDAIIDISKVEVKVFPIRADYHEEMKYIDKKTRDMVATMLHVLLFPLEGLSAQEKHIVQHYSRGNGIQLLSPDSVDPARPLLNGFRATTLSNSLDLLKTWMNTCVRSHTPGSNSGSCVRSFFQDSPSKYSIRVIDVEHRTIVEKNPESIDYAALSYVWSTVQQHAIDLEAAQGSSSTLPPKIPKVIDEAIFVCKKLSIPYLWVDRYCIDRSDSVIQASEIQGMGHRYHYAKLTLLAARGLASDDDSEVGLLPASSSNSMEGLQRVETIQGRRYITSLPSIIAQIHGSAWVQRAWTMQEGQLSNRCAFFGDYDISFMCGLGHWRESLHSGIYAHEAEMPNVKMDSQGYHILSWGNWWKDKPWKFEDYNELIASYTTRNLSFESDKLNAITGCLNLITERKGVSFVHGLPATDFHYALLWGRGYDRPRAGFPSWSWAGWHSLQQSHIVYPSENGSCSLEKDENGDLQTTGPTDRDTELDGLLVRLTERPHRSNKCSQRFAKITSSAGNGHRILTITSEIVHFSIDMLPNSLEPEEEFHKPRYPKVPYDFDSTDSDNATTPWDPTIEYKTPYEHFQLRDDYHNIHKYHYPRWYDHWPPFKLDFPSTLRGDSLTWLLKEGIELVMIVELELVEGDESLKPFHLVLCLGIDRRRDKDVARRFGMFCLPKEMWEKACPTMGSVTMC